MIIHAFALFKSLYLFLEEVLLSGLRRWAVWKLSWPIFQISFGLGDVSGSFPRVSATSTRLALGQTNFLLFWSEVAAASLRLILSSFYLNSIDWVALNFASRLVTLVNLQWSRCNVVAQVKLNLFDVTTFTITTARSSGAASTTMLTAANITPTSRIMQCSYLAGSRVWLESSSQFTLDIHGQTSLPLWWVVLVGWLGAEWWSSQLSVNQLVCLFSR